MTRPLTSLRWLALLLSFCGALSTRAQSNLVFNPSFEIMVPNFFYGWSASHVGGAGNQPGAADGGAWVSLGNGTGGIRASYDNTWIYQELKTVPGRVYDLRFATRGNLRGLKVLFGDTEAGTIDIGGSTGFWFYTNYTVTAVSTNTRLTFDNASGSNSVSVDAVSVRWMEEPPSILKPVVSRSAYEGATVGFSVKGEGVPPLSYQWHRDGQLMTGQTSNTLTLTNITLADSGRYYVVISNAFGTAQSLDAILAVSALPQTPLLYRQPKNSSAYEGNRVVLYTVALSHSPVSYQWRLNDADISGATNSSLVINAVSVTDAGTYTVVVSNQNGVTASLPATLNVASGSGGSAVAFANAPSAPFFDVDGITALVGTNYATQLYCGAVSNDLHAIGEPVPFGGAGFFTGVVLTFPDVPSPQFFYVQVRVWERVFGECFEEAQAYGSKYGKSAVLKVRSVSVPAELTGLASFNLEAGLPLYASAKLDPAPVTPEGGVGWLITGEVGTRYLIEYSPLVPPSWMPLMVVTNQTGTVSFVDTSAATNAARIYRAQILSD